MSSDEADTPRSHNPTKPPAAKKQRVPRVGLACDRCRKRKIKCNGTIGGEKCVYCVQLGSTCEYKHAMQKFQVGYVKALENQILRLNSVLRRLHPDDDFSSEVGASLTEDNWDTEGFINEGDPSSADQAPSLFVSTQTSTAPPPRAQPLVKAEEASDVEGDEAMKLSDLTDEFQHLTLRTYLGPHSSGALLDTALNITFERTGARLSQSDLSRFGRPIFWRFNSWEYLTNRVSLDFPPPDLFRSLVDLYFEHQNLYMPILHRPTFERHLAARVYDTDISFGFLVMQVCANGARYSDDPRVLLPGAGTQSAGWKWFDQVRGHSSMHNGTSRLFDLQSISLATVYLMGCSAIQAAWVWCGHGIRLAQDVGAHKKKTYSAVPNAVDEQFKRAFWVLVSLDKHLSASMARPCATTDENFDLDFPIACDDEYWEHPDLSHAFRQPEGLPSRLDVFVHYLKLYTTVSKGINLIFASPKGRALLGAEDGRWEQPTVADLDSRLNTWTDNVPTHLRWDPGGIDDVSLLQSAHLWSRFHSMQITLHRPFIAPRAGTPKGVTEELGFPSWSICLSAARSTVRIIECIESRFPGRLFPLMHKPVYEAGMMLFLGIWGSKKFGVAPRVEEDLQGIYSCERFLETLETRIHPAGRHRDVIKALLSLVDVPVSSQSGVQKRSLDDYHADGGFPAESTQDSSGTLASLDDWFAGAQYGSMQPSLQHLFGSITDPANGEGAGGADIMNGIPDPLFAPVGSEPYGTEHSLPLQGWDMGNTVPYNFENGSNSIFDA
ncbi:unnamed protein product [Peniophora sp. CBMAI 1063]|nr:unnamed protein product [Peniophora sp. CBMAI 1063]